MGITGIREIVRNYYKQLYALYADRWKTGEMGSCTDIYNKLRLGHEELEKT